MLDILNSDIMKETSKFLFKNKIARTIMIIIFSVSILAIIGILIYTKTSLNEIESKYYYDSILPFFVIPAGVVSFFFVSYLVAKTSNVIEKQLENLRAERVQITKKIEEDKEPDIFHTIQLSLNQLNEYYTINKGQARSSFQFSLFAIVIGLLTILIGIWLYYLGNSNIQLGYITGISGILLEFIGGAYFFMYKKSLEQVNFFFGQLIKIQDTMLSINLAKNIEDKVKKTEMHEKIIVSLLERSLK